MQVYHINVTRLLLFFLLLTSCTVDPFVKTRDYPVINTQFVTGIDGTGADFYGSVLDVGTRGVSDHGFVFYDTPYPTISTANYVSLGRMEEAGFFSIRVDRNMLKDVTYYVRAYGISKGSHQVVYGQTMQFMSLGSTPQQVDDFTPKQGSIGDTVLILGTGFTNVKNYNYVNFGVSQATVIAASSDSLKVVLASGVLPGENEVSVRLNQTKVAATQKFLLYPITLTSITPTTFSFGDVITINGTHFPKASTPDFRVSLLDEVAVMTSHTETTITILPSRNIKKSTGKLTLTAGVQIITFPADFHLE